MLTMYHNEARCGGCLSEESIQEKRILTNPPAPMIIYEDLPHLVMLIWSIFEEC